MENRNNKTENKANNSKAQNAKNCSSNKAENSASNGKHPNQYTKGADDKSAKNCK